VDHDTDLAVGQPERLRRRVVEDPGHRLHLQEMVARAEAADLAQAAVHGTATDLGRVGAADRAVVLAPVQVTLAAVTVRHGVGCPAEEQLFPAPRHLARCWCPGDSGGLAAGTHP